MITVGSIMDQCENVSQDIAPRGSGKLGKFHPCSREQLDFYRIITEATELEYIVQAEIQLEFLCSFSGANF